MNSTELEKNSIAIIDAVKAESSRIGLSGKELAERIGQSKDWMSDRLSYKKPFTTDDLSRIADAIGITISNLLDSAEGGKRMHPDRYIDVEKVA